MRAATWWLTLAVCLYCQSSRSHAVPASGTSQVLLGEVDIAVREEGASDISTEEPFLKKCIVDGSAYSHSQTIPSYDPNSHCLCVAGEVYCWWQNYNSASTESSMGTSTASAATTQTTQTTQTTTTTTTTTAAGNNYTPSLEGSTDAVDSYEASGGDPPDDGSAAEQQGYVEINSTYSTTSQAGPVTCLVMGREYREGEVLPHSTGNCIECSCGSEGRVECSPRDCVALPEAPDGDFEVFNLARDRGMDESF